MRAVEKRVATVFEECLGNEKHVWSTESQEFKLIQDYIADMRIACLER